MGKFEEKARRAAVLALFPGRAAAGPRGGRAARRPGRAAAGPGDAELDVRITHVGGTSR